MLISIIHLSDIHYRAGWHENQTIVLDEFIVDLQKQITSLKNSKNFLVFSGDIVQAGEDSSLYNSFIQNFSHKLDSIGLPRSQRICVPGNHDISLKCVSEQIVDHEGIIAQKLNEKQFNDYISNPLNVFSDKFSNYLSFENDFAAFGIKQDNRITGAGWNIDNCIGIYCLNSAFCCSGALKYNNYQLEDKGRLLIDTRNLYNWNRNTQIKTKVLIMHHPIDWLSEWANSELKMVLYKDFSLCLSGHQHSQLSHHSISNNGDFIECSAPPLFTNKFDELGYSIITITADNGIENIIYRQWTKYRTFKAGVNFSNTENGIVAIKGSIQNMQSQSNNVNLHLKKRLDEALKTFTSQPIIWIDPILRKIPEIERDDDSIDPIDILDIISEQKSRIIKAPPQFGLTCLSHFLRWKAWCNSNSFWLYLDAKTLKPNDQFILDTINDELITLNYELKDIKGVILDSWINSEKNAYKLLEKLFQIFDSIPIIIMQTVDEARLLDTSVEESVGRHFEILYLWTLPIEQIRKVVIGYNEKKHISEEDDKLMARLVSDLEMLNIHRTPLNCLTLLKVSEIDFEESPVNRTEMIQRVLFLLFNIDEIPTYKTKPDFKDCQFVLGYFCELMIRIGKYEFTRDEFLAKLHAFCEERFIDLEVQVVFDVLYANNIFIRRNNSFCFKFAYWVYYFLAQRMHHDEEFARYIFENKLYANYPDVIEFYTGIDRRRDNALTILSNDLRAATTIVREKIGLPKGINPYKFIEWKPSEPMLQQMQDEITNGVLASNLPDAVKDQFLDSNYDRTRPYNQEITQILNEHSFIVMSQTMKASSKALRNSDYVDPKTKNELLHEILNCWEETSKLLLVLLPLLAEERRASFDGTLFFLDSKFSEDKKTRINEILSLIPQNVVLWTKNDLFSNKLGPLLINQFIRQNNPITKHELILLLIIQRPRGWYTQVQNYISSISHNSFYLADIYCLLRGEYQYSYASPRVLSEIEYLIKMIAVKHTTGTRLPSSKLIKKFTNDVIPDRIIENKKNRANE